MAAAERGRRSAVENTNRRNPSYFFEERKKERKKDTRRESPGRPTLLPRTVETHEAFFERCIGVLNFLFLQTNCARTRGDIAPCLASYHFARHCNTPFIANTEFREKQGF